MKKKRGFSFIKNKILSLLIVFIFFFSSISFILILQTNLTSSANHEIKPSSPNTQPIKSFFVGGGGIAKNSIIQNQDKDKIIPKTEIKTKYKEKYIRPNNTAPVVGLKEPINNFVSNNGDIEFTYSVHDDGLLKECILYTDSEGSWQPSKKNKNYFVQPDYPLHFSLENLPNGNYKWNIICEDDGSNFNTNNNFSFTVNKVPPEVSKIPDLSLKEDGILTLNLSNYFSDRKGDKLFYDVKHSKNINIKIDNATGIATLEPEKNWYGDVSIVFTAFDEHGMKVDSDPIKISVSQEGNTPPRFTSLYPENNNIDDDGYIFIECNATDDNELKEVSLYSDTSGEWKLEETKETSGLIDSVKFNLTGLSNGKYEWACLAKDNNGREAWSEKQKIKVEIDVEIKHDIFPIMVNNVDYSAYVTIILSSHLKDLLTLSNLTILKSNGEVYLEKNMNEVQHFEVNSTNGQKIVYPYEIRIIPSQIFDNDFRIGKRSELTFVLDYTYKGQLYKKETKHEIEIVKDI